MTQMPFSPSPEGACPQVPDPATAGSFFTHTQPGLFPDSLFPNTKSRGVVLPVFVPRDATKSL